MHTLKNKLLYTLAILLLPLLLQARPNNPTNLTLQAISGNSVKLTWEHTYNNETGFKIYRDGNLIKTVGIDTKSYHDSGLNPKSTYRYMVKSTDGADEERVSLVSPLNSIHTHRPTFTWRMIDGASYSIMVRPLLENGIDPDWDRIIHTQANIGTCNAQTKLCTYTPDIDISGNHVWWIQNNNNDQWSERGYFSVAGYTDEFSLDDGTDGITRSYGVWGNYKVIQEPEEYYYGDPLDDTNITGYINIYHPDIEVKKRPVIFFISGWGRPAVTYNKYLKFLASHGYYVAHIYDRAISANALQKSYDRNLAAINQVGVNHASWIDTTKVGLVGHSYGAGSTVWLGSKVFGDYGWGNNGRFLLLTAPWYPLFMEEAELANYPANTKLLVQFSHDEEGRYGHTYATDPRAIRAMFQAISIPDEDKDFITVHSDNKYVADHYISYTGQNNSEGVYQPYNALDVLLLNRLSHAMTNLVFAGDDDARIVALGNGSVEQKTMSNGQISLPDLVVTDRPIIDRDPALYTYPCQSSWYGNWKLTNFCDDVDGNGVADNLE